MSVQLTSSEDSELDQVQEDWLCLWTSDDHFKGLIWSGLRVETETDPGSASFFCLLPLLSLICPHCPLFYLFVLMSLYLSVSLSLSVLLSVSLSVCLSLSLSVLLSVSLSLSPVCLSSCLSVCVFQQCHWLHYVAQHHHCNSEHGWVQNCIITEVIWPDWVSWCFLWSAVSSDQSAVRFWLIETSTQWDISEEQESV